MLRYLSPGLLLALAACAGSTGLPSPLETVSEQTVDEVEMAAAIGEMTRESQRLSTQRQIEQQRLREMDAAVARLVSAQQKGQAQLQALGAQRDLVADLQKNLADAQKQIARLQAELRQEQENTLQLQDQVAGLQESVEQLERISKAAATVRSEQESQADEQAQDLLEALGQTRFGVHLVTYRQKDQGRQGWQDLIRDHEDLLQSLIPRLETVRLGELGGEFYRLLAGPFPDAAEASETCRKAEARGLFCEVRAYQGEPLGS